MSNIVKTVNFLKEDPENRFLEIVKQEDNSIIGAKAIYLSDIPNEDLAQYIKFHVGNNQENVLVWVEIRQKNGTSSRKITSVPINVPGTNPTNSQSFQNQPQPQPAAMNNNVQNNAMDLLGNPEMLGQIIGQHVKAARYDEVVQNYDDLKEINKDQKRKIDILDDELRNLKTIVATAKRELDFELKMARAEKTGFFDSAGGQKLLEKIPEIFEKIAVMKGGAVPQEEHFLGDGTDISQAKKDFLEFAYSLPDDQINFLSALVMKLQDKTFSESIQKMINPN